MAKQSLPDLSQGNRFQRAYHAWAAPQYARMEPGLRADAQRMDRFLYSRQGLGFWFGLVGALVGSTAGLTASGFPFLLALAGSLVVWVGLPMAVLGAWLQPDKFNWRTLVRKAGLIVLLAYVGALVGFVIGRVVKHGGLKFDTLGSALWEGARLATPLLFVAVMALLLLLVGVATWRRQLIQLELAQSQAREHELQREQDRLRLENERDAAARQAAEARLRLLQAQIQPHFIFNTLAALQHWVDTADPRAGPLLRALSGFLRQSVALLERAEAPLAEEIALLRNYGEIMQARLGDRLRLEIAISPDAASLSLPPGLVLTLVENAIEHGISPALAGGTVQVSAFCDGAACTLRVQDDGVGLSLNGDPAAGVGLRNCRERLATLYGERARLDLSPRPEGGTCAEVRIEQGAVWTG